MSGLGLPCGGERDRREDMNQGRCCFLVILALCLLAAGPVDASDWQTFKDCRLLDHPGNDGDSFHVQAGDRQILLRLYFVDCSETSAGTDGDAKRVREQAMHFGIVEMRRVIHHGEEARKFTAQILSKPFTVHTTFATALGRSSIPRNYGMVTTADGKDLGRLLVEKGLARAYGAKRQTPDGVAGDEMGKRLQDVELGAMMERVGVWSETDPKMIAEFRAKQREEEEGMKELRTQLSAPQDELVNLNTASAHDLQSISGIGPVLASRIIAQRPYKSLDDLLQVPGISHNLMEKLRPRLTVSDSTVKKGSRAR